MTDPVNGAVGAGLTVERKFQVAFGFLAFCTALSAVFAETSSAGATAKLGIVIAGTVGLLISIVGGLVFTRQMTTGVKRAQERLTAIAQATNERLKPAIEALADGDLTVRPEVKTKPLTEFARDEFGALLSTAEDTRNAIIGCYEAYNNAAARLEELVSEVSTAAVSVGDNSRQMAEHLRGVGTRDR